MNSAIPAVESVEVGLADLVPAYRVSPPGNEPTSLYSRWSTTLTCNTHYAAHRLPRMTPYLRAVASVEVGLVSLQRSGAIISRQHSADESTALYSRWSTRLTCNMHSDKLRLVVACEKHACSDQRRTRRSRVLQSNAREGEEVDADMDVSKT